MATLTGNSSRREQRLQSLMLDRLVVRYERRVMREIRRAMRAAAKAVSNGSSASYERSEHGNRMQSLLNDLWFQSGKEFSEHILGTAKAGRGPQHLKQARYQVPATTIMDTVMADWIREQGGIKITQISDTTLEDVNQVIAQGIKDGKTEKEIAKQIRVTATTKSASRAQTIARTETHAASQAAANFSAQATGIDMRREWVASGGERTRPEHDNASGQIVGMHESFTVGGESLMYPGDPNGSAGNIINCRCAVIFVL